MIRTLCHSVRHAIGYAAVAAVFAGSAESARAESVSAAREGVPATARLEFRLVVPHSLSLRVTPITNSAAEAASPVLHAALAANPNLRLNRVTVASNAGPVTIADSSQADSAVLSTGPILSSVYANSDPADPAARPSPRRARVTRHNAVWVHAQPQPQALIPTAGKGRQAAPHVVPAPYIAAVP